MQASDAMRPTISAARCGLAPIRRCWQRAAGWPRSIVPNGSANVIATATRSMSATRRGWKPPACGFRACRPTACCRRLSRSRIIPGISACNFTRNSSPSPSNRTRSSPPSSARRSISLAWFERIYRDVFGIRSVLPAKVACSSALSAAGGAERWGEVGESPTPNRVAAHLTVPLSSEGRRGTAARIALADVMTPRHVTVGDITLGNDLPLVFIIGPNTLESRAHALETSTALNEMANKLGVGLVYKTSFDKANRSSLQSERGIGLRAALPILSEVRETTGLPVLTDVHEKEQCAPVAKIVDILQIPAFLCRQTDLLLAAGATGKPINIKKGQFLAPWDIKNAAAKIASTGNERIMLCERGTSLGYNTLIFDMRTLPIMAETGYPVVFDATHSVAQPGGLGDRSGGQREFAPVLARAAAAVGVAPIFIETHQDPDHPTTAEGPTMVPLKALPGLLETLVAFDRLSKARTTSSM